MHLAHTRSFLHGRTFAFQFASWSVVRVSLTRLTVLDHPSRCRLLTNNVVSLRITSERMIVLSDAIDVVRGAVFSPFCCLFCAAMFASTSPTVSRVVVCR